MHLKIDFDLADEEIKAKLDETTILDPSDGKYIPISGGTATGPIKAPSFQTGDSDDAYFQTKKMRGEGDANTYYHAVDWGYEKHDQVDFHEHGGVWNFLKNTSGRKDTGTLVGKIDSNGWNGGARLSGAPTAPTAAKGTNTTQIATTAFVKTATDGCVSASQGAENAGKVLAVGSDGIVVPTASSGGGGGLYILPIASSTTLGGVKIGDGISIGDDGTISASGGGGEKEWRLLQTVEITEPVTSFEIDKDSDGNPFSVNEIHILASNITASTGMNPQFYYVKGQPWYEPTHQIINGSFTDTAKHWNFYAFSHGKLAVFTLTSQWNNGALQYVPVIKDIPGSTISYFKLTTQYGGQTFNTGTFKIYGR